MIAMTLHMHDEEESALPHSRSFLAHMPLERVQ